MTSTDLERHAAGQPAAGMLTYEEARQRAAVVANSGILEGRKELHENPNAVMMVGLYAQDLGVPFMTGINEIFIVKGRPSCSAQLRLALVRRAGHEVYFLETTAERAVIRGRRKEHKDDPNGWVVVEWTIEQAQKAKLTSKDNWQHYPAEMLRARAASALCRMHFSDVLLGIDGDFDLYTPEEHGVIAAAEVDPEPDTSGLGATLEHDDDDLDENGEPIAEAELVDEIPGEHTPPEEIPEAGGGDRSEPPASDDTSPPSSGTTEDPARSLAQQIAIQADKAGVVRGDVILAVTQGRTSSGREVTNDEGARVLDAISKIASGVLQLQTVEVYGGEKVKLLVAGSAEPPVEADDPTTPDVPEEAPPAEPVKEELAAVGVPPGREDTWTADQWRAFFGKRKVKVVDAMRAAHRIAADAGVDVPASLDELAGKTSLCEELRGWVEDQAAS